MIQDDNKTTLKAMVPPTNEIIVEWRERIVLGSEAGQIITVLLRGESQTVQKISVEYERELEDTTAVAQVPQIHALNVDRETGYLGVEAITSVEIHPAEFKNLKRIDSRELPRILWEKARKPIILGFRYIEPENIELTLVL